MRAKLVAGNWKMHGSLAVNAALLAQVRQGVSDIGAVACAVCVPFPYLAQAQSALAGSPVSWGAQTSSEHAHGAYTGEVSVAMIAEFGARYVIVGHSERRALYGETDDIVAAKFAAVLAQGLRPILCVGESLAEREAERTLDVVQRQIDAVVARCGADALAQAEIAYEPVWAIGTGRTATPEQAQEVHAAIRAHLAARGCAGAAQLRILYGGSVKAANAQGLFAMPDIDGGLIGGAALVASEFLAIVAAGQQ